MFERNPEKLDAKALSYEQRGKSAKAIKYREKAARMRANQGRTVGNNYATSGLGTTSTATTTTYYTTAPGRTQQQYEQNALKWEQRGNYNKAQKNREKVWRLQNPQCGTTCPAPSFYSGNQFVGYNNPTLQKGQQFGNQQQFAQQQGPPVVISTRAPTTVETHVHPTVLQQTNRPEKIVEVQPVIHRDVDAPEVHMIERHTYETVPSTGPALVTKQAIVQETVHPRIIEEVQPVVHREVPAPFLERVEQHVNERVVAPTSTIKEVFNDPVTHTLTPGIAAGGPSPLMNQGFGQNQGLGQNQSSLGPQQGFVQNPGLGQQGLSQQQGFAQKQNLGQNQSSFGQTQGTNNQPSNRRV